MLWFNFILGLIFLFFCFKFIIRHYHTQKQKKIKIKPKIKLNHNIDIKVVLQFTTCCLHVWLAAVFITHLRNTRLSIGWVQLTLWNIELLPHFRPTCYRFQNSSWSIGFTKSQHSLRDLRNKNGGWDGTGKSYFHSPIFAVWNGTPSFNWQHQYVWIVCKKRGGFCRLTECVCAVASNKRGW